MENGANSDSISSFFQKLFHSDFMPHGHCFFWRPEIVWLHTISDLLIMAAYYSIPFTLIYFVRKREDIPFHWIFILFSSFIFWCGTTHLLNVVTLWIPVYRLDGVIKAITAGISVYTAVLLIPIVPKALALKTPRELELVNQKLEDALEEKEILLREIHHRVKNNLQIISSLLRLQSVKSGNEEIRSLFLDSQSRVLTMALLHERLYKSETISNINLREYFQDLVRNLFYSYGVREELVGFRVETDPCIIEPERLIPCGLIINELVSNSLKYAFPEGRKGEIFVGLTTQEPTELLLTVKDNGVGLPLGFDYLKADSLGLQLVRNLSAQLRGKFELINQGGIEFRLRFPISLKDSLS